MDYQPNILASTLASKKSAKFVTLLPQSPSPEGYWNKPFIGMKKRIIELKQYGVQIQPFTFNQSDSQSFVSEAKKVLELQPDGIVFAPFFKKESLIFIAELKQKNIPFVFIDSEITDAGQLSYIGQNSYQSGLLSGKLLDLILPEGNILIIHFAKSMDNINHLAQREKGFYDWFNKKEDNKHKLFTSEVANTVTEDWMVKIKDIIKTHNIKGIFVTNSKVHFVGKLVEKFGINNLRIIGHDLLKENKEYLVKDIVQFLICQRPEEQGYNSVNMLFRKVVQKRAISKKNYTSIDIVTKENVDYYKELR